MLTVYNEELKYTVNKYIMSIYKKGMQNINTLMKGVIYFDAKYGEITECYYIGTIDTICIFEKADFINEIFKRNIINDTVSPIFTKKNNALKYSNAINDECKELYGEYLKHCDKE